MLIIAKQPIPDLSVEGAIAPYAADIAQAFVKFAESTGDTLDEAEKRSVLEQLTLWSKPDEKETFPSWPAAIRAAYARLHSVKHLGAAGMSDLQARSQEGFAMAMGSVNWANCGKTSDNILFELKKQHSQLAPNIKSGTLVRVLAGQGTEAIQLLMKLPDPGHILLLDCTFPLLHTFVVEVHPNGNRYLCQGYQGAYYANWWTGKDESGLVIGKEQDKAVTDEDRARLQRTRDEWGLGKVIPVPAYKNMVVNLGQALDEAGKHEVPEGLDEDPDEKAKSKLSEFNELRTMAWQAFAKFWLDFPFFPVKREADSTATRTGRPEIQITVIDLPDLTNGAATSVTVPTVPQTIKG